LTIVDKKKKKEKRKKKHEKTVTNKSATRSLNKKIYKTYIPEVIKNIFNVRLTEA